MSDQQIENGEPRVITDSEGLMAQFVEVPVERDIIPIYCAFPQGQEMMPVEGLKIFAEIMIGLSGRCYFTDNCSKFLES